MVRPTIDYYLPQMPPLLQDWFTSPDSASHTDRILVLDGGVSTHLESNLSSTNADSASSDKLSCRTCAFPHRELWSSSLLLSESGRRLVRQGHDDWLRAGANVLSTVTYQCHYQAAYWPKGKMATNDKDSRVMDDAVVNTLWNDGVEIAQQAVKDYCHNQQRPHTLRQPELETSSVPRYVVASSGCYGAILANGAEYTGNYGPVTVDDLVHFHRRKVRRAVQLHPDGIAIETVPSLLECHALVQLFQPTNGAAPMLLNKSACWISVSCRNERELNDGTPLVAALNVLSQIPCTAVSAWGLNCCSVTHLPALVRILTQHVAQEASGKHRRGLVLYPNSGERWDAVTGTWHTGTGCTAPAAMASELVAVLRTVEDEWRRHRPTDPTPSILIGGCCRTSPATIAALRVLVDDHLQQEYKGWF